MILRFIIILLLAVAVWACDPQPELCVEHTSHERVPVKIDLDWTGTADADPASVSVYFFPDNDHQSLRYEFAGSEGGVVTVPVGRYTVIAVNSDSESVLFTNSESLEAFEVRLRDAYEIQGMGVLSRDVPRAPGSEDERMTLPPSRLWHAQCRFEAIADIDNNIGTQPLTLKLCEVVSRYNVRIDNVTNMDGIESVSASLSGMAASMFLHDRSLSSETVTISFNLFPLDGTTLKGSLTTLGHCGQSQSRNAGATDGITHKFTVYAVLADGSRWYHSFDVTEQIHSSGDTDCDIVLDGLNLPAATEGGGGFDVDVKGWTVIPELIEM